jgi:hypothetical protein
VLSAIPKTWIPVEKGDVNKKVRKMIVASLSRSAAIAWDSRPRIPQYPRTIVNEPNTRDPVVRPVHMHGDQSEQERKEDTITIPPDLPVWGEISHNGWSSPLSSDLPNLQYTMVILELPHLIEARAVSLAPPDADSTFEPPLPDIRAVDILQRPVAVGLRDYLGHLASIGVVTSRSDALDFLSAYEFARFSSHPLSDSQFRDLMKHFAEVLRGMVPLGPDVLASLDINSPESDIDDDVVSGSTPRSSSPVSSRNARSRSGSEGTVRTAPSRQATKIEDVVNPPRTREGLIVGPMTPMSKKRGVETSPSEHSFAQSRRPYNGSSGSSDESLRSTSRGSVIRLRRTSEAGDLPYTFTIPESL